MRIATWNVNSLRARLERQRWRIDGLYLAQDEA